MSLTVKAFLQKSGSGNEEIRRFSVPADVSICYDFLCRKISDIFPSLGHGRFTLYWKDSEGDQVAFSTDEELLEALGFVNNSLLKIYMREKASNDISKDAKAERHVGVGCDGCGGAVVGNRYKCMECPDYDLCSNCEKNGIHKEHDMMRITTPMAIGYCAGHNHHLGVPVQSQEPELQGPFVIPHYFRRWMQKFMRRWFSRNGPGLSTENKTEDSKIQNGENPKNLETEKHEEGGANVKEECLKTFEKSVDTLLDPFDIDDSIYIDHNGRHSICGKGDHGSCIARGNRIQGMGVGCTRKQMVEKCESEEPTDSELASLVSGEKAKDNGIKSMETESKKQPSSPMKTQPEQRSTSSSQVEDTILDVNSAISSKTKAPSSTHPVLPSLTSRSKD